MFLYINTFVYQYIANSKERIHALGDFRVADSGQRQTIFQPKHFCPIECYRNKDHSAESFYQVENRIVPSVESGEEKRAGGGGGKEAEGRDKAGDRG